jgi:hypothetical protein
MDRRLQNPRLILLKAAGTYVMLGSEESEIAVIGELLKDAVMQQEAANGGIG